ncbi:hypothetical protein F442_07700, partial [Phytophthora nicotianae P10297]
AGAWQFIDSVQVVIDGTTVQTNQVHENVNTTFKAITETDYNTYVKHGPTSNFVLDEYATPTIQGSSGAAQSLDNLATSSFMTATNNVGQFGLANTYSNRGAAERSLFTPLDQQSSKLAFDVMGGSANLQAVSKPQVYVAPAGAVAAGSPFTSRIIWLALNCGISATISRNVQCRKTRAASFTSITTAHRLL